MHKHRPFKTLDHDGDERELLASEKQVKYFMTGTASHHKLAHSILSNSEVLLGCVSC